MWNPARLSEVLIMLGNMRFKALCCVCLVVLFACTESVSEEATTSLDSGKIWNELLLRYVNDRSFINYKEWKNKPEDLDKLERLVEFFDAAPVDLESKDASTLTFLINAYNAFVIHIILKHYPVDSVQGIPKFFTRKDCRLAGKNFALNEIETMIRQYGDARTHATLSGGSKSAPPIKIDGFSADRLDNQLNEQMQTWLSNRNLNDFDCSDKKLSVSKIFLWYKRDFGKDDRSMIDFLKKFRPDGEWRNKIESGDCRMDFMEFDGSLNDTSVN